MLLHSFVPSYLYFFVYSACCYAIYTLFFADHHDELFYICLLFGVVVLILLSSILVVIGRIVLNKRRINNATKLQTSETGTTALPNECTETISDEMDIDLTTPATIPSISRNNVSILWNDSAEIMCWLLTFCGTVYRKCNVVQFDQTRRHKMLTSARKCRRCLTTLFSLVIWRNGIL